MRRSSWFNTINITVVIVIRTDRTTMTHRTKKTDRIARTHETHKTDRITRTWDRQDRQARDEREDRQDFPGNLCRAALAIFVMFFFNIPLILRDV